MTSVSGKRVYFIILSYSVDDLRPRSLAEPTMRLKGGEVFESEPIPVYVKDGVKISKTSEIKAKSFIRIG